MSGALQNCLPLEPGHTIWRDEVIGWANVTEAGPAFGYLTGRPPKERSFSRELEAELSRLETFLTK